MFTCIQWIRQWVAEAVGAAWCSFSLRELCMDSVPSLSDQAMVASEAVKWALGWCHFAVALAPFSPGIVWPQSRMDRSLNKGRL